MAGSYDTLWYPIMKNIIVADNDYKIAEEICSHLSSYRTHHSDSGSLALEMAKTMNPDLILLDLHLQERDGFSVLDKLQENSRLANIPVILLTNDDSSSFQARGIKSGVVDFILKRTNCPKDKIIDWETMQFRIDMHLELGEYRVSLEHSISELENNIGLAFAELIECKDYNFSGHIMRTEKYSEFLVHALYNAGTFPLDINPGFMEDLCKAVPFHDIGKIGVSDEILCKRGPLNDDELKAVRSHTSMGAKILDDISKKIPEKPYFKTAGIIAQSHHERYDGKGYPAGLSGENIPLASRIVSVVNVYDACVSERVYHLPMSHEDALKEIEKGSNSEFDPKITKVFLENKNEFARLGNELKEMALKMEKFPAAIPLFPAEISA